MARMIRDFWIRSPGKRVLSRRTVLRGALGGAAISLGLPALEAMLDIHGEALALDGVLPKRFGLFFWGNGNRPDLWTPAQIGSGSDWDLSVSLQPLAAVKEKLIVVSGTEVKLPNDSPHSSGAAGVLSAAPLSDPEDEDSFTEATIDQVIANEIGDDTLYRSLEVGVAPGTRGQSFNGANSTNPPETSPILFYDRVFGPTFREPGDTTVDPRLGLRRSILDGLMGDIGALQNQVGAADKARLEQHFDGLRDLESRLAKLQEDPPDLEACLKPLEPAAEYPEVSGRPPLSEINAVMSEMIAMALACDQTRVFSQWLSDPVSDVLFDGASAGHHDLTHNEGGEQPEVQAITVQCMEMYASLLTALDAVPEGSGTLLDNCVVMACSEVSLGQTHSIQDMPVLIGGSGCGFLQTDQHFAALGGENVTKVLLTLMKAMDMTVNEFGVGDAYANQTLSALIS